MSARIQVALHRVDFLAILGAGNALRGFDPEGSRQHLGRRATFRTVQNEKITTKRLCFASGCRVAPLKSGNTREDSESEEFPAHPVLSFPKSSWRSKGATQQREAKHNRFIVIFSS